ncbi:MAG: GIY-YIG nuclease family protein [Phycisphaerae bacterium]
MIEQMTLFFIGILVGLACIFPYVLYRRKLLTQREQSIDSRENILNERSQDADRRAHELQAQIADLNAKTEKFAKDRSQLDSRIITVKELGDENLILKRDLQNIDVNLHKLELDHELQQRKQEQLDGKCKALAERYMSETVKAVVKSVGSNNFSACKQRLLNVIGWCREIGFGVTEQEEARHLAELRTEFEKAVRAALEAEEQSRIKAQIREEQKLQKEIDIDLKQLDRERVAIQAALDRALAEAQDQHSELVQSLRSRLAEAEEKSRRAVSQAQQTKAGFVYVISNIGSFGQGVFKIGMTRRLDPQERVDELGNASVPFPFDVHLQINCSDAPALENALHRELNRWRLNKANPRKEYFRTDLAKVVEIVRAHHGDVQYVADAEALEYHQSLNMTEQDADYIAKVYGDAAEKGGIKPEDP